jgi:hypothetical protein
MHRTFQNFRAGGNMVTFLHMQDGSNVPNVTKLPPAPKASVDGVASSLVMLAVPLLSLIVALALGALKLTVKVSVGSKVLSLVIATVNVLLVSEGAKLNMLLTSVLFLPPLFADPCDLFLIPNFGSCYSITHVDSSLRSIVALRD